VGSRFEGTEREVRALSAFINLTRAANSLAARHNRRIADAGLTLSQFGVLEALLHLGPLPQKDLGHKLLKTSGNITMVVDNLERNGLVRRKRDGNDRRFISIHLTGKGKRLIKRVLPGHVGGIVDDMSLLNARELDALRHMCRVLGKQEKE